MYGSVEWANSASAIYWHLWLKVPVVSGLSTYLGTLTFRNQLQWPSCQEITSFCLSLKLSNCIAMCALYSVLLYSSLFYLSSYKSCTTANCSHRTKLLQILISVIILIHTREGKNCWGHYYLMVYHVILTLDNIITITPKIRDQ